MADNPFAQYIQKESESTNPFAGYVTDTEKPPAGDYRTEALRRGFAGTVGAVSGKIGRAHV